MVLNREEESVEQPARDSPGLMHPERLDERREPAAPMSELHEFVEVGEVEHRLERLCRTYLEAICRQRPHDLVTVGGVEESVVELAGAGTAQLADEPGVGLCLERRDRRLIAKPRTAKRTSRMQPSI